MNLNKTLITELHTATGFPVAPDEYDGTEDKYIIFTYVNERPELFGDNLPIADTAYLQLQLITPKSYNYMTAKHTIRDTLEGLGFIVTSIYSMLGDVIQGTDKIRQTIFEVTFTEPRTEE